MNRAMCDLRQIEIISMYMVDEKIKNHSSETRNIKVNEVKNHLMPNILKVTMGGEILKSQL